MIVLDTSAIMAILLQEPAGRPCIDALASDPHILISAGTLAEAYLVAQGRKQTERLELLRSSLGLDVIPVDAERAKRTAEAHRGPRQMGTRQPSREAQLRRLFRL